MAEHPDDARSCKGEVRGGEDRRLAHLVRQPTGGKRHHGADRVMGEVEGDGRRQRRRGAQLGLHDLGRPEREERRGEVAQAEDRHRAHQPPKATWQRNSQWHWFRSSAPRVPGDEREQDHAHDTGQEGDPEDRAEIVTRRQQQQGNGRSDQGARGIQRLMEAKGLAEIFLLNRPGEHGRPNRLPKTTAHPGQRPGDDDLRPGRDRNEQTEAQDRATVASDRELPAPRDAVAVPTAPQLDHG